MTAKGVVILSAAQALGAHSSSGPDSRSLADLWGITRSNMQFLLTVYGDHSPHA